ncbi:MAG: hexose kinase [Actinobacteria bacterium]|nr:hexose kinase [Actinomycetota bacterium]
MTAPGGGQVVCVALNAALDITYVGERFVAGEANRVGRVHAQAGGKAVNVARLLHQAGHDVLVTGFAGGLAGDEIARDLDRCAIPHCLVRCAAGSRRTVSAYSAADAAVTAYNESGPRIAAAEWARFAGGFGELVRGASAVVLSGSLPDGIPVDAYHTLAGIAGRDTFVDAHTAPLRAAVRAGPALAKPNEHELAEAAGLAVPVSLPAAVQAARGLLADGAQRVVVSLGGRGLLGVLPGSALVAVPPAQRGNTVGAGDAALAALVEGQLAGQPWPERLRRAAAKSAAAVRQPVAGAVDPGDVAALEALVTVSEP